MAVKPREAYPTERPMGYGKRAGWWTVAGDGCACSVTPRWRYCLAPQQQRAFGSMHKALIGAILQKRNIPA